MGKAFYDTYLQRSLSSVPGCNMLPTRSDAI